MPSIAMLKLNRHRLLRSRGDCVSSDPAPAGHRPDRLQNAAPERIHLVVMVDGNPLMPRHHRKSFSDPKFVVRGAYIDMAVLH